MYMIRENCSNYDEHVINMQSIGPNVCCCQIDDAFGLFFCSLFGVRNKRFPLTPNVILYAKAISVYFPGKFFRLEISFDDNYNY